MRRPLTKIEKDRMIVMFLSFLLIIVFWGAFEQAGGLMSLYTDQKTDLNLMGFEVPAAWFQSVNAFFIITLGTTVGGFWYWWKKSGKEGSSLFKMAVGLIIMGWGFFFMTMATLEVKEGVDGEVLQKASMIWLILALSLIHI